MVPTPQLIAFFQGFVVRISDPPRDRSHFGPSIPPWSRCGSGPWCRHPASAFGCQGFGGVTPRRRRRAVMQGAWQPGWRLAATHAMLWRTRCSPKLRSMMRLLSDSVVVMLALAPCVLRMMPCVSPNHYTAVILCDMMTFIETGAPCRHVFRCQHLH